MLINKNSRRLEPASSRDYVAVGRDTHLQWSLRRSMIPRTPSPQDPTPPLPNNPPLPLHHSLFCRAPPPRQLRRGRPPAKLDSLTSHFNLDHIFMMSLLDRHARQSEQRSKAGPKSAPCGGLGDLRGDQEWGCGGVDVIVAGPSHARPNKPTPPGSQVHCSLYLITPWSFSPRESTPPPQRRSLSI